jgi:hypothetical protein
MDVNRLIGPNNETEGSLTGGESQLDIQVIASHLHHSHLKSKPMY